VQDKDFEVVAVWLARLVSWCFEALALVGIGCATIAFSANPSFQVAHCRTQRQGAQCEIEVSVLARDEEAGSDVRRPSWLVRMCQILSRTMWILWVNARQVT
jgi:hypothetical protein